MFGTLINDLQHKESLTFVENTDPASALSRSRRDKPHISCEFCRSRKVRCSGQPSGCDRCTAVSMKCRYPGREARGRKRPASQRTDETTRPSTSTSSSDILVEGKEQGKGQGQGQGQRQGLPFADAGGGQAGQIQPRAAGTSFGVFGPDHGSDHAQRQIEQWLSSYSVGDGGPSGSGLDEWLNMDSFLDPMFTAQTEDLSEDVEVMDDAMGGSLSGDASSLNGFDDADPDTSQSGFPSPDSLGQPLMSSPYDFVSPLTLTIPSTRSQPPASTGSETLQASPSHMPSLSCRSGQSSNKVQPASEPLGPARTDSKSSAQKITSASSAAAMAIASFPGSGGRSQAKGGCCCLYLTARLLEELGAESASSDPAAMDVLLGCFRRALVHCATILDCDRCTSLSENNMLLAMAGKYMSAICERIVICYIGLRQTRHQRSVSSPKIWTAGSSGVSDEDRGNLDGSTDSEPAGADMWFSTYRIESDRERMQVLRCLVTVQLTEFSRLLEKLKARAGSRRGHLVLLTEAEKKIKVIRSMLRATLDQQPIGKTQEF